MAYRALDTALWALNWPFERVPEEHRRVIGYAGVATIVVSVAAVLLLPRLCPPQDVVSQIRRSRVAAEARLARPAPVARQPGAAHSGEHNPD